MQRALSAFSGAHSPQKSQKVLKRITEKHKFERQRGHAEPFEAYCGIVEVPIR